MAFTSGPDGSFAAFSISIVNRATRADSRRYRAINWGQSITSNAPGTINKLSVIPESTAHPTRDDISVRRREAAPSVTSFPRRVHASYDTVCFDAAADVV